MNHSRDQCVVPILINEDMKLFKKKKKRRKVLSMKWSNSGVIYVCIYYPVDLKINTHSMSYEIGCMFASSLIFILPSYMP